MGKRLYVGNLPFSANDEEVRGLFEQGGEWTVVEVRLITERETGRPRGFGFVEMESDSEAQAAITALNGQEYGGRVLTVNEARERTPYPPRGPRGGGYGGGRNRADY